MEQIFTISVFTENAPGLLLRVTTVFARRKLNIESITASVSEIEGIHRYTIVLKTTKEIILKVVDQLEKQVEVLKAFFHEEDELVFQEIALYKVPTEAIMREKEVEQIVREFHARILTFEKEFIVIEKTGHQEDTQELYDRLEPYGILEFVRSGRVAITKPMKKLTEFLKELENKHRYKL
ncbi:MAG: acetolactate synthase small subunit [Bacteroidota bacterium]